MAPGPDGGLYVSIPRARGAILALLDRSGRPRPGWPMTIDKATVCDTLLPVDDGSVRVVCDGTDLPRFDNDMSDVRAFAFMPDGRPLAGWPVRLRPGTGELVGGELTILSIQPLTDTVEIGQISREARITTVGSDGTIRSGERVPMVETCCWENWAIGPDVVGYGTTVDPGERVESPKSSTLMAVSADGIPAGFPISIDGMASKPAFDGAGRIHVTVVSRANGPARMLVFDADGDVADGGSGNLGVGASDLCIGIEGDCEIPAAPLVGPDGTRFVIDARSDRTIVAGVGPTGRMLDGWPHRSDAGYQGTGYPPPGDIDWGPRLAAPAIGPGNVLFLLGGATDPRSGGSITSVGRDGRVRAGWPVGLKRPEAGFWSVVIGPDGTAFALAIEPEARDTSSASIIAIAPDSTVLYTATIIDP